MSQVFLINNVHYICSCFKKINEHPVIKEDLKVFEEVEAEAVSKYVNLTLNEHFSAMMLSVDNETSKQLPAPKLIE